MSDETEQTSAPDQVPPPADLPAGAGLVEADWTDEQVEQWREQAGKAQEYWERLLRVSADFDNFKKRSARERQEAVRYANESLIEKIIPVLDSLEMALAASSSHADAVEGMKTGVEMIYSQLKGVLRDVGLEEIDAAGQPFDPNWHEAVAQQPSVEVPEGSVVHQLRKGFRLKDRLIRPASVVVAKKPEA